MEEYGQQAQLTITGSVLLVRLVVLVRIVLVRRAISMVLVAATIIVRREQLSNFRYRPRVYVKPKENLKHPKISPSMPTSQGMLLLLQKSIFTKMRIFLQKSKGNILPTKLAVLYIIKYILYNINLIIAIFLLFNFLK